ncbi:MAG TPA: PAS domain S-box protein [Nitrospiraceae bacterium]|nr:PAS domain S-box protein [Nitrospiraceae bacterium]
MTDASVVPDKTQVHRHLAMAVIMAGLLGIFTLDSVMPLGYAVWFLYVFPIWYSTRLSPRSAAITLAAAAASTALIVAGYVVSPPGGMSVEMAAYNRLMGAVILWGLTAALLKSGTNEERVGRSQAALEESEAFNRAVVESSPDCMKILDREGRLLSLNSQGLCLMEIEDAASVLGRFWWDLWPESSRGTVQAAVQEAVANGTARFQGFCPTAKGTPKWWDVIVSTVRGLDGQPMRLVSTSRDMTVIKRAEEAVRESEERHRVMVEQVRDYAIIMLDPDGRVATWNAGAQRHTGYTAEEVIGMPLSLFLEPGARETARAELEQAAARGVYEQEGWRMRKDGSRFWAHVMTTPLRDETGALRGFTKVWRDNTQRKLAETQFQQLVEQSPNGILTVNRNGRIVLVNKEGERIFGYNREELLNQPVELLLPKRFRDGHPAHRAHYVREAQARPMGNGAALTALHKSGREFPVEVGLTPIETFQGMMTLCTVVDVTERKRAEEAILAANRELEAFTYTVSHDLRAPVRTMAGFARILMEDFGPTLDPEAQRHVRTIQKGAQRMGVLIDDLLEFSRVGRAAVDCRPVDLNRLVDEVWTDLKPQREGRIVELTVADLPPCLADRRLLRLVWTNLLANAVKYTGQREQARIEVGWQPDEEQAGRMIIRVADNGVGFDQKYVGKLFGVFQRLHRADEFEGTGVGLAIVHRIVTRHGGRVWAEGRLGEGATFYFTLEKAV